MNTARYKHQQPTDDIVVNNLQKLMQIRNITEAELSRQTNIPQPTIHKILSGQTNDPRISTLKTMADYFGVNLDQLYSHDVSNKVSSMSKGISIPIISWEECLNALAFISQLSPNNWQHWMVIDNTDNQSIYGLVTKPSMEPRFPRGTTLIVDPKIRPEDGDFVIIQYPNTNEATIRELSIDGPTKLLLSPNHNLPSDKLEDSITIIATVVQSRFIY